MRLPTFKLVRYAVAYLLGAFLVGWGLWCLGYELLYPAQVARESEAANGSVVLYAPSIFSGVIIYLGIVLFLMPRFDFVSGALVLFGSIVAGFAMVFLGYWVGDGWGRVPASRYLPVIAFLGFLFLLGCGSMVTGVIWYRHRKKSESIARRRGSALNR
jgi:hypothetical protein